MLRFLRHFSIINFILATILCSTAVSLTTPTERVSQCCVANKLPPECLELCNYRNFTSAKITAAVLGATCDGIDLSQVYQCISGGLDHTKCCEHQTVRVATHCVPLCDARGFSLRRGQLMADCVTKTEHFDRIRACFKRKDIDCAFDYVDDDVECHAEYEDFLSEDKLKEKRVAWYQGSRRQILKVTTRTTKATGSRRTRPRTRTTATTSSTSVSTSRRTGRTTTPQSTVGVRRETTLKPPSPKEQYTKCCNKIVNRDHNIKQRCGALCAVDGLTREKMTRVYSNGCSLDDLNQIYRCANRGHDHTRCCRRKQLGNSCVKLCKSNLPVTFNLSTLFCLDPAPFRKIKQCFREHVARRRG